MAYHARSISLPSTPNPITTQFEEQLLRSSETTSTSSSSSSSITYNKLTGLTELYVLVDELLQLPSNQQSLSQIQSMLDGSLSLLDVCSLTRDVLLQSKENVYEIQSVFRRRCSDELNVTSQIAEYLKNRKTVKKLIKKCLKNIKVKSDASDYFLSDVQEITMDIFASLLSDISGSKSKTSWSAVTKFIHKKEALVAETSVFYAVDATLESLVCQKKTGVNIDSIMNQMVTLESEIEQLDEVLECLFRYLIKTRSTLLNILSN